MSHDDEVVEAELVEDDERPVELDEEEGRDHALDQAFQRGFAEGRGSRVWVFEPGDRVLCLVLGKLLAGTVKQVRMPGPIRPDCTVQVILDEIITDDKNTNDTAWFHPEQVERLGD